MIKLRTLLLELEQRTITDIINWFVNDYQDQYGNDKYGKVRSAYDINNGHCPEFAADVINAMGGYTNDLYEIDAETIWTSDKQMAKENWQGPKIETEFAIWSKEFLDREGYPPVNINKVDRVPAHIWIYYKGKHYDAELPAGGKWYELPLMKKFLGRYK